MGWQLADAAFYTRVEGEGKNLTVSEQDLIGRVLASLHEATLDDVHWPETAALISEACGLKGHFLVLGERSPDDAVQTFMTRFFHRGQRRTDWERLYYQVYHALDERPPRLSRLPDSLILHARELYTEHELRTSPAYNEALLLAESQNSLHVRLDGSQGTNIIWIASDPLDSSGWRSAQIDVIKHLLPHIRQFVSVRQVLVEARALAGSLAELLDTTPVGAIYLDRRGRIVEMNDPARNLLLQGAGLHDMDGVLGAWLPKDDASLQRLLAQALPPFGSQAVSGSTTVGRSTDRPALLVHVVPIGNRQVDFRTRAIAAVVLVVDPQMPPRPDAPLVAAALGLTAAETQVAIMLAVGRTARGIALATGRKESSIRDRIRRIHRKLGISRQADLIRMVLSISNYKNLRR